MFHLITDQLKNLYYHTHMPKRFILGDIHGKSDYLRQVLEKSGFDYENDLLIQIGDIVDRGPDPFGCMDILLQAKNLVLIMGNHDQAFMSKVTTGQSFLGDHAENGQQVTLEAYDELSLVQSRYYKSEIFAKQLPYYITEDNILFVHGGFDVTENIKDQSVISLIWDREMFNQALSCSKGQKLKTVGDFKEIYIGHTPTIYWGLTIPILKGGVINIDTGSGKGGPLTIMDIDSKEFWQSDNPLIEYNGKHKKEQETGGEEVD